MEEKKYSIKLRVSSMYQIVLAVLIIVLGIFMLQQAQERGVFYYVYILLGMVLLFRYFNMPKEIIVDEELVTLRNWFGKDKLAYIKDIKTIQKRMGYLYVRTDEKRLVMPSGFNDLKMFADDMKARNSGVEVTGIK